MDIIYFIISLKILKIFIPRPIIKIIASWTTGLTTQIRRGIQYRFGEYTRFEICRAACLAGNFELVIKYYHPRAFKFACKSGIRKIINLFTTGETPADYPQYVCAGPNIELINESLEDMDIKRALIGAGESGNRALINTLLQRGAYPKYIVYGACKNDNIFHIKDIKETKQCAKITKMMKIAAKYGNLKAVVCLMLEGVPLNWGLYGACRGGYLKLFSLFTVKGADDWDPALIYACRGGNLKIVKFLVALGAANLAEGAAVACRYEFGLIVKFLLPKIATPNWPELIRAAGRGGSMEIIEFLISSKLNFEGQMKFEGPISSKKKRKRGENIYNHALAGACEGFHWDLCQILVQKGAELCAHCSNTHNW